jgi:hypothetical protein
VPLREVVEVLAVTEYEAVPLPDPLVPEVMLIHEALLLAVHAQPEPEVTLTDPVPAVPETELLVGEMA